MLEWKHMDRWSLSFYWRQRRRGILWRKVLPLYRKLDRRSMKKSYEKTLVIFYRSFKGTRKTINCSPFYRWNRYICGTRWGNWIGKVSPRSLFPEGWIPLENTGDIKLTPARGMEKEFKSWGNSLSPSLVGFFTVRCLLALLTTLTGYGPYIRNMT